MHAYAAYLQIPNSGLDDHGHSHRHGQGQIQRALRRYSTGVSGVLCPNLLTNTGR